MPDARTWNALSSNSTPRMMQALTELARRERALRPVVRQLQHDPASAQWVSRLARIGAHLAGQRCSPLGEGEPAQAFVRTLLHDAWPPPAHVHQHLAAPAWRGDRSTLPAASVHEWRMRIRSRWEDPESPPLAIPVTAGAAREWLATYRTTRAATASVGYWAAEDGTPVHMVLALALALECGAYAFAAYPLRITTGEFWPALTQSLDAVGLAGALVLCENRERDPRQSPAHPLVFHQGQPAPALLALGAAGCHHPQGQWSSHEDWMVLDCPQCARRLGYVPLHRLLTDPEHGTAARWALYGDPTDCDTRAACSRHYLARERARRVLACQDDVLEWDDLVREPAVPLEAAAWALPGMRPLRTHSLRAHLAGRA